MTGTHAHHDHYLFTSKGGLLFALSITLSFAIVEAISAWLSGSLALWSDAGHMFSDGLSLGLAAFAAWIAAKPPSQHHSYGLGRAEVLGAWISSIFMVIVAIEIILAAVERLYHPTAVTSTIVIGVALLGLLINAVIAFMLSRSTPTLNIRAAMIHIFGDLLGSVATLISGIVIHFTHWTPIDPLLSLFIAALILFSSIRLLKETLHVLMEGVPMHLDLATVGKRMAQVNQVISLHDLHIWTLSSGMILLSAHIHIKEMQDWKTIHFQLTTLLANEFSIKHVTLQPEVHTTVLKRL